MAVVRRQRHPPCRPAGHCCLGNPTNLATLLPLLPLLPFVLPLLLVQALLQQRRQGDLAVHWGCLG